MRHYDAYQLMDSGGRPSGIWHYATETRGGIVPVGGCSPFRNCPECANKPYKFTPGEIDENCPVCKGKRVVEVAPCPGHNSKEQAYEHQKQYMLDNQVRWKRPTEEPRTAHRCKAEGCKVLTDGYAQFGEIQIISLCGEHQTREELAKHVDVGEMWIS